MTRQNLYFSTWDIDVDASMEECDVSRELKSRKIADKVLTLIPPRDMVLLQNGNEFIKNEIENQMMKHRFLNYKVVSLNIGNNMVISVVNATKLVITGINSFDLTDELQETDYCYGENKLSNGAITVLEECEKFLMLVIDFSKYGQRFSIANVAGPKHGYGYPIDHELLAVLKHFMMKSEADNLISFTDLDVIRESFPLMRINSKKRVELPTNCFNTSNPQCNDRLLATVYKTSNGLDKCKVTSAARDHEKVCQEYPSRYLSYNVIISLLGGMITEDN